ncbi:hypothetical protein CAF53_22500 [Sphingobium sp. LB126]|uniref:helix-turn-helix domain-containing protein n=1 Tax=Sphingobium sp. LB126 TaxID=1983755 RepID=UPI000C1FE149|nr:cupin domain-containing protein [Sphingobium sp. LB126]PJG45512.1 hypothetical protein CAF53_22500 [Sphingobium sp. LB126]
MATRAKKEGNPKPRAAAPKKAPAPTGNDDVDVIVSKVGKKIEALRRKKRLSLQNLADISDVSPGAIHKIERSGMVPTITTLLKLATALGVTVGYFVEEDENASAPFLFTPAGHRQPVYTPHEGLTLGSITGSYRQFVTAAAVATMAPGASSGDQILNHTGEELIFVLSGEVVFRMDEEDYVLKPGDALHFQGGVPHHWENRGTEPAQLIWYVFRNREGA